MRKVTLLLLMFATSMALASVYIPSSETSSGRLYGNLVDGYYYLLNTGKAICLLSGLFLTFGGVYQYSQHRKDPVYVPFSKVLVMFVCAVCAFVLAYMPGVQL